MSYNFNHTTLVGRLVRDPELKSHKDENPRCTFVLAISRRITKESSATDYIPITIWGKFGENANRLLKKGTPVLVSGRIQIKTIQTNGEYRSFFDVIANNFQILETIQSIPMDSEPEPSDQELVSESKVS